MLLDDIVGASWHVPRSYGHVLFVVDVVLASFNVHLSYLHPLLLFHLLAIKVLGLVIFDQLVIWLTDFFAFSHCPCSVLVIHLIIVFP